MSTKYWRHFGPAVFQQWGRRGQPCGWEDAFCTHSGTLRSSDLEKRIRPFQASHSFEIACHLLPSPM